MRKTSIFAVCLMLAGTTTSALAFTGNQTQVQQQKQSCRGVVKDAKGEMIIGATVQVKGTTNYCCPVKLKKHRNPSPKSYIYGLLRICYKK